jgi:hypothetical protein
MVIKLCRAFGVHKWFALVVERRHSCVEAGLSLGQIFTMQLMWNSRSTDVLLLFADKHCAGLPQGRLPLS